MTSPAAQKNQVFWSVMIGITVIISIYSTIYSLTHGIYEVFPFLYFLPIILFVYFYPNRGIIFSLLISTIFLLLVYYFGNFDPNIVAVSTAWFVIFVTIGVVTSSFAGSLRTEEQKYREIFENSQAGIFTFDPFTLKIKAMNGKCALMLRYDRTDLIDKDLSRILIGSENRDAFIRKIQSHSQSGEDELFFNTRDGAVRQFLVSASRSDDNIVICSTIDITERKLAESVIAKARGDLELRVLERTDELLRANEELKAEIQERKRFESAIQLANRKLNTLSSITRHDILNQITAIVMYLSLAEEQVTDPTTRMHLQKIEQVTQLIQKQIRFTRDYQSIGSSTPRWQQVSVTVKEAITDLDLGGVAVETALVDLEVYTDSLLEKVFYNLVENALRHGEKVTKVRFYYKETSEKLTIFCEDNGVGIPTDAKERIFKREYYRNTGYGLFLASEILSITGLTIKETGEPGKGARFEIAIPIGVFRFSKPQDEM
ncbi:MAG: PAS domain-containing sensor histidine kinase [Methanoregula sp.]|nr:PAS domain-containing sensor histidine kinase [Methanoregula sp.]